MMDGINAGLPSDRVEVVWKLKNARVKQLSQRKQPTPIFSIPDDINEICLLNSVDNQPVLSKIAPKQNIYLVEIPTKISALKAISNDLALKWRIGLRGIFEKAFQAGYSAQDFVVINERYYYVLFAEQRWYMYVLECSDQTLYTGITPDLKQRLTKHNSGRGAAYTKTRRPVTLMAAWQFSNRQAAMKAEITFKQLSRQKKLDTIASRQSFRDAPFVGNDV